MPARSARVALAACLAAALLLLLADLRGGAPTAALRGAVGAVAGPVEEGLSWVGHQVSSRVGGSEQERVRITELESELAAARSAAAALAGGQVDERTARELAAAIPSSGYRAVAGRVVAQATQQDQVRSVAVSVGSRDGVAAGMAVVGVGGLAGIVASVAPGVSTVRLVVDAATGLPARVAASGEQGVLRGTGDAAALTLLDPLGAMAAGDLVTTMPSADGTLPAGLPVGRVTEVLGSAADLSRRALVTPAVDDSTLDRVVVLVPEAQR